MSEGRTRKKAAVSDLVKRLENTRCIILTDFTGISVEEMTYLRSEMRSAGVTFRVVKNTIARRALDKSRITEDQEFIDLFKGPTAVAYSDSEVMPVKVLKKFSKKHKGRPVIKGGLVSGRYLDVDQTSALGDLPGREEMLSIVLGTMMAPLQGFATATGGIIRNFMNVLNALIDNKKE